MDGGVKAVLALLLLIPDRNFDGGWLEAGRCIVFLRAVRDDGDDGHFGTQ